jgi:hypothetical protein
MQFASRFGVGSHLPIPIILHPWMQSASNSQRSCGESWSMAALISATVLMAER